jgi:5-bromo-4-chloroindolyl phosphate hydrolysis protein
MDPGETIVAIGGMITGIIITSAIVWGVVQGLRAQASASGRLSDQAFDQELNALRDHMDAMQQQLNEAQERLDFTERLLAQQRTPEQLPRA